MWPWPPGPWGAAEEEAPEEADLSAGSDQGEAWSSGEDAPGEPGTPPQDSPSGTPRDQQLPGHPRCLVTEQSPGPPGQLYPHMTWEVAPPRTTLLSPWDPNYQEKARPQTVWGAGGSGVAFSSRTLCHPSFWPMYEASGGSRGPPPPTPGPWHREPVAGNAGLPVLCREDVFLLDPLLPGGQRVPLYLSEPPQQAMGSLRLLLPPPIMSPSVRPSAACGLATVWLSGRELIALTGLLQMSQGDPRPSSSAVPQAPAGHTDPVSNSPGPIGGQSCPGNAGSFPARTSDAHCP